MQSLFKLLGFGAEPAAPPPVDALQAQQHALRRNKARLRTTANRLEGDIRRRNEDAYRAVGRNDLRACWRANYEAECYRTAHKRLEEAILTGWGERLGRAILR